MPALIAEFGCLISFPFYTMLIAYFGSEAVTPRAPKGIQGRAISATAGIACCRSWSVDPAKEVGSLPRNISGSGRPQQIDAPLDRRIGRSLQGNVKSAASIQLREKRLPS